jgi:hypothetical protein
MEVLLLFDATIKNIFNTQMVPCSNLSASLFVSIVMDLLKASLGDRPLGAF